MMAVVDCRYWRERRRVLVVDVGGLWRGECVLCLWRGGVLLGTVGLGASFWAGTCFV